MFSFSQKKLISYFENAVGEDSLRQTYIIKGESGLGKKEALKKISEYIMCHTGTACGSCNGCQSLLANANPDCIRISNGDKKTIEIQKIRELIKEVYIKPIGSKHKLFIIENAHLMDAAPQNALLKVIEEPPQYAVFVLVCDSIGSILPTILSRAFVLELERSSIHDLKLICPLGEDDEYMYAYCLGNIGTLKNISSDDNFKSLRDKVVSTFCDLIFGDEYSAYEAAKFWIDNKENKEDIINILIMFLRDIVLYKNSMTDSIANRDKTDEIKAVSGRLTLKGSFDMLEAACDMPRIMGKYGNFSMAAETMMLKIKRLQNG